jgi:hypothetical protein
MKKRVSLSLDGSTAEYLAARAQRETGGNVSALLDRMVRAAQLAEALKAEADWYAANLNYAEAAEAERYAA